MLLLASTPGGLWAADPPAASAAVPCGQEKALAARFASVRTMRARFTEEKRISLLAQPLVSEGRIVYVKPDRIRQDTDRPARQTVLLSGTKVRILQHDLGREQTLDLASNSTARAIVRNILLVMSGRVEGLSDAYACTLSRPDGAYQLHLVPKQEPLTRMIRTMTVHVGADLKLRSLTIDEVGGDSSTLTFADVKHDEPLTEAQVKELFEPPAPTPPR